MKRIISLLLIISLMLCFSGCCFKHEYTPATCTTPPTCTKCGEIKGEKLGHDWSEATCLIPKTCLTCKTTDGDPLGHSWSEATCANPKTCSICNLTDGNKLEHSYTKETTAEATCTSLGIITYTCDNCKDSYTEDIEMIGHSYSAEVTKDATCEKEGVTTYTCECGHSYTESIKATGHNYSSKVTKKATCEEAGVKTYTCNNCNKSYTESIKATGHDWADATCTEPQKCSICKTTSGKAVGHDWKEATCTTPKKCETCKETSGKALGHDWQDATCTDAKICSRCESTSGSALGHSYSNGKCSRCDEKDSNYINPILVYQDSKVKIYYKQYTNNGVVFEVENLTNVTITIQADTLALNYRSTDNISMSDDVSPYSIGEVVARCSISDVENVGIISGQLRIIDFNKSFRTYDATFVNVVVDSSVNLSKPSVSQPLVYSDSRVKIYYKEMHSSGVVFTVENLTNVVITIQADSISINKRSTDNITMSDDVSPQSRGDVVARCSFGNVPTVELVSGQLRIIDFNDSFRTYDATFYNVSVK